MSTEALKNKTGSKKHVGPRAKVVSKGKKLVKEAYANIESPKKKKKKC
jgi:hypothetical protein